MIDTTKIRNRIVTRRDVFRKNVGAELGQIILDLCTEIDALRLQAKQGAELRNDTDGSGQ